LSLFDLYLQLPASLTFTLLLLLYCLFHLNSNIYYQKIIAIFVYIFKPFPMPFFQVQKYYLISILFCYFHKHNV
jgi:hypothetical protein